MEIISTKEAPAAIGPYSQACVKAFAKIKVITTVRNKWFIYNNC